MYYYLDTYVGSGTVDDPWRPSLSNIVDGVQAIDLRPDPTVGGHCLSAALSQVSASGVTLLTTNLDSNISSQAINLAASWGLTFTSDMTWRQAILILLDGKSLVVNGKHGNKLVGRSVNLGGEQIL